jgi:hypothetical protein
VADSDDLLQRYREPGDTVSGVADFMGFTDRRRIVAALRRVPGSRRSGHRPPYLLGALADLRLPALDPPGRAPTPSPARCWRARACRLTQDMALIERSVSPTRQSRSS